MDAEIRTGLPAAGLNSEHCGAFMMDTCGESGASIAWLCLASFELPAARRFDLQLRGTSAFTAAVQTGRADSMCFLGIPRIQRRHVLSWNRPANT